MDTPDTPPRIEAREERLSTLCAAILRISASLDLETVLQEIVDSARALTHAACGAIVTTDERGRPGRFLSSGLTPDEHRRLADWTDGIGVFEHFRDHAGAWRVADLPGHVRSLGFSCKVLPSKASRGAGTAIHHRGVLTGSLFVGRQKGEPEFSHADEQVLGLLASQAAASIANAHAYRDERRARADLEALADTSPVVALQDLTPFEEHERTRTEFLAIVGHELRMSLTSIKGSTATVLGTSPGFARAEMLQFFRIIDAQADQMSGLLGELMDAGRVATGTLSVSPQASDAGALVDRARNTLLSAGARQPILVDLPPDLPRVMVDRQRIIQVLTNLLSNAVEHAPASSPIQVTARRDGAHVAISVTDRGRGIPPDRLPHLFRKTTDAGDGEHGIRSGFGLAICKGLVEAHGGRIWAASDGEGQGARFTFTVPVAEGEGGDLQAAESTPDRAVAPSQGRKRDRVLVVDDDAQTLRHLRDVLKAAGYAPLVTGDHRELSRLIRTEKPALVLLDLMLPGTDGIQLLKEVPDLADQPVIFISAYSRAETIARALGAGAADYIVKPFSATELTARVRAALRSRAEPAPYELEDLAIDYAWRRVTVDGRPVELTATEYEVLRVLSLNAGRATTYRSLMRQAWKRWDGTAKPKLVHAVVRRLRGKLGEGGGAHIRNVRGVGYRMPGVGG